MAWDVLAETGRMWRVRAQVADDPGRLAALATGLSERGCNLLGVTVLPMAGEPIDPHGTGSVVDELVLRAPAALRPGALVALIEAQGGRCVGIAPAAIEGLVDGQTAVLRAATTALSGRCTAAEALRLVLGADTISSAGDGREARDGREVGSGEVGSTRLHSDGHRVTIDLLAGEQVVAKREWAPFTDSELARVPALIALLEAGERRADLQVAPPVEPLAPAPTPREASRRQLSALDVQFLNAETATTLTHVGGLSVLDPSGAPSGAITVGDLRELVASRLHLVAPLRWRLHQVPLGLDLPYWVDSGSVDLDYHIREVRLPKPGTDELLGEQVAHLAESPLDRDRPLWECYLIHGLAGGRQALYTKVHHALIDGVSSAEVLAMVFDLTRQPRDVPPPQGEQQAEAAPGAVQMLGHGARRALTNPWHLLRAAPTMAPHLLELPGAASLPGARLLGTVAGGVGRLAGRRPGTAAPPRPPVPPATPFNGPITARRAFAFTSLPLDDVKHVKKALGFTVNDVVMALCSTALRRWLIDHDALPAGPLVAAIPVSVRTREQLGTAGNQIGFMPAALPTDVADPVHRLQALHTSLAAAKRRFRAAPARLLHEYSATLPQVLHGAVSRALLRAATVGAPPFNLFISNVSGPQLPLYAAGAEVIGNFPVSVVSDVGGGINITVMSYNGHLDVGIIVCPDVVPDVWKLATYLREALAELHDVTAPGAAPVTAQPARVAAGIGSS